MFHFFSKDGPKKRRLYALVHVVMISTLLVTAIAVDAGIRSDAGLNRSEAAYGMTLPNR